MKKYVTIFVSIILLATTAHGQKLILKKSKTPFFKSGDWIMDISEIKIYDDDLIVGRIKFTEDKLALDTIQIKIDKDTRGHLNLSNFNLDNNVVSEAGNGFIHFYSTKFKKKYIRGFLYFVSTVNNASYLTIIIDIENSGDFYPLIFSINKIPDGKENFEVQLLDTKKQMSDVRLVRVHP